MTAVLTLFIILIFLQLTAFGVLGFLAWQKISVFLTWNTRYQTAAYERAVTTPKAHKSPLPAQKLTKNGRALTKADDLIDLADLADWEQGYKALEDIAHGA